MEFLNDGGEGAQEEQAPREPPKRQNAALAVEELRLAFIKEFGANSIQKTEITTRQRQQLAMLMNMGHNLFPISSKIELKGGKKTLVTSEFLIKYMGLWIELGIPVGRKGRKEEVEVLTAILGEPHDDVEPTHTKNRLLG